jgi:hypothetical protein
MTSTRTKGKPARQQFASKAAENGSTNGKAVQVNAAPPVASSTVAEQAVAEDDRVEISITTDEHKPIDNAAAVLGSATDIYQRGGDLVRVLTQERPSVDNIKGRLDAHIRALPPPQLRSILTKHIRFVKEKGSEKGGAGVVERIPVHPPPWLVAGVFTKQIWEGVPHLKALVDYPVLLRDGRILNTFGYDAATGLFQSYSGPTLQMPEKPTREEAKRACELLFKPVSDFPFKASPHRSSWLAACLSPFGRFVYQGPTPLFFVDANIRGSGKTLLMNVIALIMSGQSFPVASYTNDEMELRKIITSMACDGDRAVLFDNVSGQFGHKVLDRALTSTEWKDRPMRQSTMPPVPLWTIFYATGNNAILGADIGRRMCYMRLESAEEHPEERENFKIKHLEKWVIEHRVELMQAALTILKAFLQAGCPDQHLRAWGSFQGWSDFIREAVVWCGLDDPGLTRMEVREEADDTTANMTRLLKGWYKVPGQRSGLTVKQLLLEASKSELEHPPEYLVTLSSALESLMPEPKPGTMGMLLRNHKRHIFDGLYIDKVGTSHSAVKWAVFPAEEFHAQRLDPPQSTQTNYAEAWTGESGYSGEGAGFIPTPFG